MTADKLPHGCVIQTAYIDAPAGGQIVADFVTLCDGKIRILKVFHSENKLIKIVDWSKMA